MTWDRVERLIGADNLAVLRSKRVAVIGLGSGGGFVALALAMSGVGSFVLIDDDVLEPANVVRHVADRRYVGWNKADAVADLIQYRSESGVTALPRRLTADAAADLLRGVDLVVSGLDGEQSKYVLNQACLDLRLPAVYAGVYERGEGGDACLILPYDGPCYACWAGALRADMADQPPGPALDYGMIGADGTLEAEPGLWLHVTRVASVQADLALNLLLAGTPVHRAQPGNTVLMANTALEILDGQTSLPHTAIWATIDRDPACLVCGSAYTVADAAGTAAGDQAGSDAAISLDRLLADHDLVLNTDDETRSDDGTQSPLNEDERTTNES